MRLQQYLTESASDDTRLQESLGAISFGVRQLKGRSLTKEDLLDQELFTKSYNQFCEINAGVDEVYQFALNKPDYVISAIEWANTLYSSGYTKGNYTWYRGKGLMEDVYRQFNALRVDAGINFKNDKWNPGDVWGFKINSIPIFSNIMELNKFISDGIEKGIVLPISLKKTKKANLHHQKPAGEDTPVVEYRSIVAPSKSIFPTGMTIETTLGGLYINFRSFRISHVADITGELIMKGTSARHGKVPSPLLRSVISQFGIPQMSKQTIENTDVQKLKEYVLELWSKCGHSFNSNKMENDWKGRESDIQNWVGYWQSIIHSLELGAWLNNNKSTADDVISKFYIGAASIDTMSSEHLKLY